MNASTAIAIGLLAIGGWALALAPASRKPAPAPVQLNGASAQILFTPWDDAEGAIVAAIRGARKQLLVQAYTFTSRAVARALIEAKARGVDVRITADQGEAERFEVGRIGELAAAGIPVWVETRYQSAHNKVMVIDAGEPGAAVITGSYNWTFAAQRVNAENVVIIRGAPEFAARYKSNWERHQADAVAYRPK